MALCESKGAAAFTWLVGRESGGQNPVSGAEPFWPAVRPIYGWGAWRL